MVKRGTYFGFEYPRGTSISAWDGRWGAAGRMGLQITKISLATSFLIILEPIDFHWEEAKAWPVVQQQPEHHCGTRIVITRCPFNGTSREFR